MKISDLQQPTGGVFGDRDTCNEAEIESHWKHRKLRFYDMLDTI